MMTAMDLLNDTLKYDIRRYADILLQAALNSMTAKIQTLEKQMEQLEKEMVALKKTTQNPMNQLIMLTGRVECLERKLKEKK